MSQTQLRPEEWETLVRANEHRCYRAALAILGDAAEAEDAVQDAFLKYLEHPPRSDDPARRSAWLLRVTVNGCKDRLRSAWRRKCVPLEDTLPAPEAPEEGAALSALLHLPPADRALLHLFYFEELPTAHIARILGCREGTVRSRLSRARAKLRALLEKEDL